MKMCMFFLCGHVLLVFTICDVDEWKITPKSQFLEITLFIFVYICVCHALIDSFTSSVFIDCGSCVCVPRRLCVDV